MMTRRVVNLRTAGAMLSRPGGTGEHAVFGRNMLTAAHAAESMAPNARRLVAQGADTRNALPGRDFHALTSTRGSRCWVTRALLAMLLIYALPAYAEMGPRIGPDKKIIKCGQDMPDAKYLRERVREMERLPFDGVVIDLTAEIDGKRERLWLRWFGPERISQDLVADSIVDLKATEFRRFTDNFLWISSQSGHLPAPGWWDDEAWAKIVANMTLAARIARECGLSGILLDTEQYGVRAWSHYMMRFDFSDPHVQELAMVRRGQLKRAHTYEEFAVAARQRGRDIMRAMCEEYPEITLLVIPGVHHSAKRRVGRGQRKCPDEKLEGLASSDEGVLAPFGDGLLEGAGDRATLIDGCEDTYPFTVNQRFADARAYIENARDASAVPQLYGQRMKVGFGLMLDYEYALHGWNREPENFGRNHFTPADFENALYYAMLNSDRYVWIWNELRGAVFWESVRDSKAKPNVPDEYVRAIRRAREPRDLNLGRDNEAARRMPVPESVTARPGYDPERVFEPLRGRYEFIADLPSEWLFFADEEALGFLFDYTKPDTDLSAWKPIPIGDYFQRHGHRFRGVAWYRTTFHVPKEVEGKNVYIIFGRVSARHVWINGRWSDYAAKNGCLIVDPNPRKKNQDPIRYGEDNLVVVPIITDGRPAGIYGPVKLAIAGSDEAR